MKKIITPKVVAVLLLCLFSINSKAQLSFSTNVAVVCAVTPTNYVIAQLTTTNSSAVSYSWSILPSNCGMFLSASAGTATFNVSCGGIYTLTCNGLNSSSVVVATATSVVLATSNLTLATYATPSIICSGGSSTLIAGGANGFTWSPGNLLGYSVVVSPTVTTLYSLTGEDLLTGCSQTISQLVLVNSSPTISIAATPTAICKWESSTLVATGANSYTWNSGNIVASSVVVSPSQTSLYMVTGEFNATGCSNSANVVVVVNPSPTLNINHSPTSVCIGQTATLSVSGSGTFTWNTGSTGNQIVVSSIANTCYSVIGSNNCFFAASCLSLGVAPPVTIQGSNTVCLGTSVTYTATGGMAYLWNTSATTNTVNIVATTNTVISVKSPGTMGCQITVTAGLSVNSSCSDVWPGDANSDGIVNSSDVFEIGLGFNSTGTARSPGGNTYVAQQSGNWSGTVSTGKNLCHADCNGDGTIDNGDTVAIFNNFGLPHSFKPAAASSNPDVYLLAPSLAYADNWNVADVMLGSSTANISQVYGLSFDLNFDIHLIDDAYLVYSPSFLNASSQNIEFRKNFISNGKVVGVIVRTDKNNVSGNGKIAELHFKVKNGLAENTPLDFSVSNVQKVANDGLIEPLIPGATSQNITNNLVGLNQLSAIVSLQVFPNPVSKALLIRVNSTGEISYRLTDLSGRVVSYAAFKGETNVNVSNLKNGVYFVEVQTLNGTTTQKVIVDHQ